MMEQKWKTSMGGIGRLENLGWGQANLIACVLFFIILSFKPQLINLRAHQVLKYETHSPRLVSILDPLQEIRSVPVNPDIK